MELVDTPGQDAAHHVGNGASAQNCHKQVSVQYDIDECCGDCSTKGELVVGHCGLLCCCDVCIMRGVDGLVNHFLVDLEVLRPSVVGWDAER